MSQLFQKRFGARRSAEVQDHAGPMPRVPQLEPAEARTFSIVEMLVLIVGFALAAGFMTQVERWSNAAPNLMAFGLLAHAAIGLGLCGPILVSWRERLGRRRPVWGLGESLWFATGLLVQIVVATYFVFSRLERAPEGVQQAAALFPIGLTVLLPVIYLTGNPRIDVRRAPGSWSNVVGLTSVALWGLTAWAASRM